MKINVVFNMQDEDDASSFQEVILLSQYRELKDELYKYARSLRKYEERESIPTGEIADKLYEILAIYQGE